MTPVDSYFDNIAGVKKLSYCLMFINNAGLFSSFVNMTVFFWI